MPIMQTNSAVIMNRRSPEGRVLVVILVKSIESLFLVVEVVEQDPDEAAGNERGDGKASVQPDVLGVDEDGDKGLAEGGTEGGGEQEHGLDERLHAGWRLGVGVLETSDRGEDLRDTDEHVSAGLRGNVDVVSLLDAVNLGGLAEWFVVARTGDVDVVLNNGGVDHSG